MQNNKNSVPEEKELKGGIIVSHGIALGKALVLSSGSLYIPEYTISEAEVPQELERLNSAILKTQQDIKQIKSDVESELVRENLQYLDSHLMMLNDPLLHAKIREDIKSNLKNIETVFSDAMAELIEKMEDIDNPYLRERVYDLRDIHKNVLMNLLGRDKEDLSHLDEDVIIVAHTITPSQAASMDSKHVKAFVTEVGGKTSHTAILARAQDIPALVGMQNVVDHIKSGDELILDANHGVIIVNPSKSVIKEYQTAKHVFERFLKKLSFLNQLPAESTDKVVFSLLSNIEIPSEINTIKTHGAEGIGLFRSEFIFLDKSHFPEEDEQVKIYSNVLKKMGTLPVIIRTMDMGGDKLSFEHRNYQEANPFLGWRSIRFSLSRPDIFKTQLRALFRSSVHGRLNIMLPMISGLDELLRAKKIIDQVKRELKKNNVRFSDEVKIGIMIEVPSAVMVADELARHVDFFSIGTNDLVQYTIAVDRGNERISYLYKAVHPAVLRFIKMTIEAGEKHSIPVEMCGEMAGNPLYTVLLMGLGIRYMSMSSSFIPEVKKIIRTTSVEEAGQMADKVLSLSKIDKIEQYLADYMSEKYPDIFDNLI